MKINYDILKSYLKAFHEYDKAFINTKELFDKLGYDLANQENCLEVYHYLSILADQELIISINNDDNLGFVVLGNGKLNIRITNFRLTHLGHQTYETMMTNKLWDTVIGKMKLINESGIKQIPTLATKIIIDSLSN